MSHDHQVGKVMRYVKIRRVLIILMMAVFMAACREPEVSPTPTRLEEITPQDPLPVSTETTTPTLKTQLAICTSSLPASLFPYDGSQTISKRNILAMLQEPGFYREGGDLVPDILTKVPTQGDGDLRLEAVPVQSGQLVLDAQGELVVLKTGVRVRPSGCRQADCVVVWEDGVTAQMDHMVVDFELKPGLTWSDGTPVTATDSYFSYLLASDPKAPGLKWAEERTAAYQIIDDKVVQWVSRPGFTTSQLEYFFWKPLPAYRFMDAMDWDTVSSDPGMMQAPLSYGPYVMASWESGQIVFQANPYYYQEGYPLIDMILYKHIAGGTDAAWDALRSGNCDVLDASFGFEDDLALLTEIAGDAHYSIPVSYTHLTLPTN